jgi:hypothetical protein
MLIRRIKARSSALICGRPPTRRDFQHQYRRKSGPMPTHERLGLNDLDDLQNRRKPSIQLDKEPAIAVREPGPPLNLTPQNDQLMSERRILCFKPALRLEWRDHESKE